MTDTAEVAKAALALAETLMWRVDDDTSEYAAQIQELREQLTGPVKSQVRLIYCCYYRPGKTCPGHEHASETCNPNARRG